MRKTFLFHLLGLILISSSLLLSPYSKAAEVIELSEDTIMVQSTEGEEFKAGDLYFLLNLEG